MTPNFFEKPILNSPYEMPRLHHALDHDGQPTDAPPVQGRRRSELITPVPKPRKKKAKAEQGKLALGDKEGLSTAEQEYNPTPIINEIRSHVASWRDLPNAADWGVTPATARLLAHWRSTNFESVRPFFCQVEAVETIIWLTEVARREKRYEKFWEHLKGANEQANPELLRIAMKMATGSGKTTVMAMLMAWQTVNAVRSPTSSLFSRGFLIVTPGITIRDRLRVLLPDDPDNYYRTRELVPADMLGDIAKAKIVITNYHAFKRRETMDLSKVGRALLQGRGEAPETIETEGQMLQRACGELMALKNVVVINDEAHHCYREKPDADEEDDLKGEEKDEAKKNNEAARLWINGIEALEAQGRRSRSLRPFGHAILPPRLRLRRRHAVPLDGQRFLADGRDRMRHRQTATRSGSRQHDRQGHAGLSETFGSISARRCRRRGAASQVNSTRSIFRTSCRQRCMLSMVTTPRHTNYGSRSASPSRRSSLWCATTPPPPSSFMNGFQDGSASRDDDDERQLIHKGHLDLFRNYDEYGNRLARPNTLLIDSEQLESGEALDANFREIAGPEIEQFKREMIQRSGAGEKAAENISDSDLLREVMNTIGREGRLGENVRCVVSVSMLTEGWDANTVTHILGVRAFGTQLLCEQVVGRGLRRQSYDLNEEGLFDVEYADILGIPFDFTAKPVVAPPKRPKSTVRVHALEGARCSGDHVPARRRLPRGIARRAHRRQFHQGFHADVDTGRNWSLQGPARRHRRRGH